eukprot:GHVR01185158.1.p1 GENE.GHVR01185158.1~~GHVR01185158.1.p1  ORF type:complete len:109 (+),score=0.33 GHVR01185158.1:640-966(+)
MIFLIYSEQLLKIADVQTGYYSLGGDTITINEKLFPGFNNYCAIGISEYKIINQTSSADNDFSLFYDNGSIETVPGMSDMIGYNYFCFAERQCTYSSTVFHLNSSDPI